MLQENELGVFIEPLKKLLISCTKDAQTFEMKFWQLFCNTKFKTVCCGDIFLWIQTQDVHWWDLWCYRKNTVLMQYRVLSNLSLHIQTVGFLGRFVSCLTKAITHMADRLSLWNIVQLYLILQILKNLYLPSQRFF